MELLADCGVIEPAIFFLGAVSSVVESADFLFFRIGTRDFGRFSFWPNVDQGWVRGRAGTLGWVTHLGTSVGSPVLLFRRSGHSQILAHRKVFSEVYIFSPFTWLVFISLWAVLYVEGLD